MREGQLEKAIAYFEQAAGTLPDNKVISANAAYAIILYMQRIGLQPSLMDKANQYLQQVRELDPDYKDLTKLLELAQALTEKA